MTAIEDLSEHDLGIVTQFQYVLSRPELAPPMQFRVLIDGDVNLAAPDIGDRAGFMVDKKPDGSWGVRPRNDHFPPDPEPRQEPAS